ncbi:Lrp/AsnC family transcriptional regulator [Mycobacterium botniense]|nr:Lrp/AsnC family transcriptional regulator [Mycobacterium botniense]
MDDTADSIPLDEVDRSLIRALVADGRISMLELSKRAHVSRTHLYSRIERLQQAAIVEGFTARINLAKAGFATSALIALSIHQNAWRDLSAQLRTLRYIERYLLVGGDFDVLVMVRTPDNETLRTMVLERLHSMPGIRSTRTWLVFDEWQGDPSKWF